LIEVSILLPIPPKLKEALCAGIAWHHSGVTKSSRRITICISLKQVQAQKTSDVPQTRISDLGAVQPLSHPGNAVRPVPDFL